MRSMFLALVLSLSAVACATAPRPVEVETVGQLAASDTHVMAAPVHATTDLARGSFVASDDATVPTALAGTGDIVEAPAVAAKQAHGF